MPTESDNRIACINFCPSGFPGNEDAIWDKAARVPLVHVENGQRPFLRTEFSVFRCDEQRVLYFRFWGEDDEWHSCFRMHDEPLYREDVFEAFISDAGSSRHYLELEVSPHDVHFDGAITYEESGIRHLNMSLDIEGWETRTVRDKVKLTTASVWALPYGAFSSPPENGRSWRINVFRIDHSRRGEALLAWQQTKVNNFHVPECFGYLDFVNEISE